MLPHATDTSASPPTPRGCTNLKLRQLTRRVTQHYDQHLAPLGLKITQYSLLAHVDRLGPIAPGELARRMEMTPSTLTRNLQPLAAAGWVTLGEGANARSRQVHITPSGRALRAEAQAQWKAAQLALNTKLGVATVAALHTLLDLGLAAFHGDAPAAD